MHKKQSRTSDFRRLNEQISVCWGANVRVRAEDLEHETDFSYIHIIKPWVLDRVIRYSTSESLILDVGCGCGYLSHAVYESGRPHIRGIDISAASIEYARKRYPAIPFDCEDICNYVSAVRYDLCLSVMTLNNLPDLEGFFSMTRKLLVDSGRVILVIPHPCYWPQRHLPDQGYSYYREEPYEYIFSTKGRTDYAANVLFFHRTLDTYFRCILDGGFQIVRLQEFREKSDEPTPDILGMELSLG